MRNDGRMKDEDGKMRWVGLFFRPSDFILAPVEENGFVYERSGGF
jgi:hypothetical protein